MRALPLAVASLLAACSVSPVTFTPAERDAGPDGAGTNAPDTRITSAPPVEDNSTSTAFEFSSDDPAARFECALDGAAFSACDTPHSVGGLDERTHTFAVRAIGAGGTDPTPASHTWAVNLNTPDTTIDAGPSGVLASSRAMFAFSSANTGAGATFECSLDSVAFAACTSPVTLDGLADGVRNFRVRARDATGAYDPTPASRSWTVDTTSPDTMITNGPTGLATSATADFAFTSNETGATFECDLDGAGFAVCSASYGLANLPEGAHVLVVRAVDPAGNRDMTPAQRTWTVDTQAPDTTLTSSPASPSGATARFDFTATEAGATFECSLDGSAFAPCDSPRIYASLTDGTHRFRVRATDPAGNTDGSPAVHDWAVDTSAPDTEIDSGPIGPVNTATAAFTFSAPATPGATFECKLDGASFAACSSPRTYSMLSEAVHQLQVRAKSASGVYDPSPAAQTWTVDVTAPQTTLSGGPSGAVASTSASFALASNEPGTTFECNLDSGGYVACAATYVLSGLGQDTHSVLVRAIDAAGNKDATPAARNWTVDTVSPDTSIASGPPALSNTASATFDLTSEVGATFECSLDSAGFTPCPDPFVTSVADGAHVLAARAIDAAGNKDPSPVTFAWEVETVHTLAVTKSGTGTGTVVSSPGTINCGGTCSNSFSHGTSVTLTALADTDSTFVGWTGGCTGAGACTVSVNGAVAANAQFTRKYKLIVNKAGGGVGTVVSTPGGISCLSGCSTQTAQFAPQTSVTLEAKGLPGAYFQGWTGACTGTRRFCTVSVDQATMTVYATFAPNDHNLVFATSEKYAGNFGGLAAADATCARLASSAGLPGTYVAWLSTSTVDARTRLGSARGWVRLDGEPFTDQVTTLTGSHQVLHPVRYDENGALSEGLVWTGTSQDGIASATCTNWTSASASNSGLLGLGLGGPGKWSSWGAQDCHQQFGLYCFQIDKTAPVTVTPVPGKKIWVTSASFSPDMRTSVANAACDAQRPPGVNAGIALLGTSTVPPSSLVGDATNYVRPDGVLVGTGADLKAHGNADVLPSGAWQQYDGTYVVDSYAWTGGPFDAVAPGDSNCMDWTLASPSIAGTIGDIQGVTSSWFDMATTPCVATTRARVYCIEP